MQPKYLPLYERARARVNLISLTARKEVYIEQRRSVLQSKVNGLYMTNTEVTLHCFSITA